MADSDLDDIADSLYALKPDAFSSARDEHVRQTRQAGDRDLARQIGQLRKPTMSAWLINLLWRDQHEVMEQLFDLSRELARAQAEAAGSELRALTQQRRQLETALLRRAVELAASEGVNVSDAVQREAQETLSAALAQPEVADEVRTGRLTKAASYAGFGGVLPAAAPSRHKADAAEPAERAQAAKEPIDLRAAQRARAQREAAQRKVEQAQQAAEAASTELTERSAAVDAAREHVQTTRQRLRELRAELQRAEAEVESAEKAEADAEHARDAAQRAHSAALRALAEAERALRA